MNYYFNIGALMMALDSSILCYNIFYSWRHAKREVSGDSSGNGRTLDWATSSAIPPHYNFAALPEVTSPDASIIWKKNNVEIHPESKFKKIHMPSNSGRPLIMSCILRTCAFGLVFEWYWIGVIGSNRCIRTI